MKQSFVFLKKMETCVKLTKLSLLSFSFFLFCKGKIEFFSCSPKIKTLMKMMHDMHIRKMHPDIFAQNMRYMLRDFC